MVQVKEIESTANRLAKWKVTTKKFSGWNTDEQKAVQKMEAEVVVRWLLDKKLPAYHILEIGAGNGYFGVQVISRLLAAGHDVSYEFTDFLSENVTLCKQNVAEAKLAHKARVSFLELDVYNLDSVYPPHSQSIILSTGYVSAAAYEHAVPKVAYVLAPNGILICDFINHLAPFKFLTRPINSIRRLINVLTNRDPKLYHFGIIKLASFFSTHGLVLEKRKTIRWRRNPLLAMFQKE